jgi:hypothetical protein
MVLADLASPIPPVQAESMLRPIEKKIRSCRSSRLISFQWQEDISGVCRVYERRLGMAA